MKQPLGKPVKRQVFYQVSNYTYELPLGRATDQVRFCVWSRVWDPVDRQVWGQVRDQVLRKVTNNQ